MARLGCLKAMFVRTHKLDQLMVLLPMLRFLRIFLLLRRSLAFVSTEKIAGSIVSIVIAVDFANAFFNGLGMLFLLAGYEVELKELTGRGGRRAMVTWLICVGVAFAIVWLIGLSRAVNAEVPVAIALTSTALGTLLPILQDRGQLGTRFSDAIMNHGAGGSSARRSPWRAHTSSW